MQQVEDYENSWQEQNVAEYLLSGSPHNLPASGEHLIEENGTALPPSYYPLDQSIQQQDGQGKYPQQIQMNYNAQSQGSPEYDYNYGSNQQNQEYYEEGGYDFNQGWNNKGKYFYFVLTL